MSIVERAARLDLELALRSEASRFGILLDCGLISRCEVWLCVDSGYLTLSCLALIVVVFDWAFDMTMVAFN